MTRFRNKLHSVKTKQKIFYYLFSVLLPILYETSSHTLKHNKIHVCKCHKQILIPISSMHVPCYIYALIWSDESVIQLHYMQNYSSYMKYEKFKIPGFIVCNFEFLGNILNNWLLNKLSSFCITTKVLNTRNYTRVGALSHMLISYIHLFRLSHWSLVMLKYHTYNTVMAQTLSVSWYFTAALQVKVNLGPNKISQALVNMSKTAYMHQ